ncbi:CPBP family intramembrane glutamic endopeptidase [Streptococcus sp. S784/96/1]|uniref:CPBP family intramembrane glutamic endopeptidase n=1 Tax=Streptococcus sp. S784/96/1 TaxID=2653499 RepID=UPI0012EA80DE
MDGSIQQQFPYYQFLIYAVIFSFVLATLYRKTQSILFCMILHGLNNIVLGYFITKVDSVLIAGLMILWGISVCLANSDIDMLE